MPHGATGFAAPEPRSVSQPSVEAYWVVSPNEGAIQPVPDPTPVLPGHSLVRAVAAGISPGTERLVASGRISADQDTVMGCRYMEGSFALPVKYGYSLVGIGITGALQGHRVFTMHPHQTLACVQDDHTVILPDHIGDARATLFPNLETAVNGVWDAALRPAEQAVVVGAGPVGLLLAFVLRRETGTPTIVMEPDADRAAFAADLPWVGEVLSPQDADGAHDVALHASGSPAGLQSALDTVGFEGRVIDLSWYGSTPVTLDLGTAYHHDRKRIQASQVGTVAPNHRGPDGHRVRNEAVLDLLKDDGLDALMARPEPFHQLPTLMQRVYSGDLAHPHAVVAYD